MPCQRLTKTEQKRLDAANQLLNEIAKMFNDSEAEVAAKAVAAISDKYCKVASAAK